MHSVNKYADYHLVEDKAYTEDDVLVYNVFVCNVPQKASKSQFCKYFKQFGELVSVHLLHVQNEPVHSRKPKIGFANFKDPVSAANVLKKTDHMIKNTRIYVKACNSWHQPDAQPAATTSAAAEDEMVSNVSSLLVLNDDCLDEIFMHLQIGEQTNLARCCCRLRDVFDMRARVQHKILNLDNLECVTLWQARKFLQMAGAYVEKLRSASPSYRYKTVIEFIGTYCINLKCISIRGKYLSANSLKQLLRHTDRVEELCLEDVGLLDMCIPELHKLRNLKKLWLDKNHQLSGLEIECLTTLHELSLNGCEDVHPIYFKRICENLKDLRYLDIQDCSFLKKFSLLDIVKLLQLHKLETIKCNHISHGKELYVMAINDMRRGALGTQVSKKGQI